MTQVQRTRLMATFSICNIQLVQSPGNGVEPMFARVYVCVWRAIQDDLPCEWQLAAGNGSDRRPEKET